MVADAVFDAGDTHHKHSGGAGDGAATHAWESADGSGHHADGDNARCDTRHRDKHAVRAG
jgi:hypothetical protein